MFYGLILLLAMMSLPGDAKAETPALLIRPEATGIYLHNDPQSPIISSWVDFWQRELGRMGIKVEVRSEQSLLDDIYNYNLIVLPGTICLDEKHILALREFLTRNGGLIMTWATGCRNLNGDWQGFDFLTELMGSTPIESETKDAGQLASLQFRARSPGTYNIPPGYRLRLSLTHKPSYLPQTAFVNVGGYWSDPLFIDSKLPGSSSEAGFITQQTVLGGRIAWFGANLDGISPDSASLQCFQTVLTELIPWLRGAAVCGIAPWPEGKQAGVLFHGDIEDQFACAINIVKVFSKHQIPNTYNLLVNEAAKYPQLIDAMIKSDAEISIHGDNHIIFQGQDYETQFKRLKSALDFVETFTHRPEGFRPPELAYDVNTLRALANLNLRYLTAYDHPDRSYPHYTPVPDEPYPDKGIVLFPKSELDDWDLFGRFQLTDPVRMADIMLTDYRRILDLGGLYKFNYHSQFLAKPQFMEVANRVVGAIKADESQIWWADAADISRWIKQRERLVFSYNTSDSLLEISVINKNPESVKRIALIAYPPLGVGAGNFAPTSTSRNCRYDTQDDEVILYVPELKAGEQFTAKFAPHVGHPLDARSKSLFMKFIYSLLGLTIIFICAIAYYLIFTRRRKVKVTEDNEEGLSYTPGVNLSTSVLPTIVHPPAAPAAVVIQSSNPFPINDSHSTKTTIHLPAAAQVVKAEEALPASPAKTESVESLARRLAEAVKTIQDIAEDPLLEKHPDLKDAMRGIASRASRTAVEKETSAAPPTPLMKPYKLKPTEKLTTKPPSTKAAAEPKHDISSSSVKSTTKTVESPKSRLLRSVDASVSRRSRAIKTSEPLPPLKKIIASAASKPETGGTEPKRPSVLLPSESSPAKDKTPSTTKSAVKKAVTDSGIRATAPLPKSPRDKVKSEPVIHPREQHVIHETKRRGLTLNTTAARPPTKVSRESRTRSVTRQGPGRDSEADDSESVALAKIIQLNNESAELITESKTALPIKNPTMRTSISIQSRKTAKQKSQTTTPWN